MPGSIRSSTIASGAVARTFGKDRRSGRHGIDTMPRLLEIAHDQLRDVVVVFDDEHAAHEWWAPCA